MDVREKLASHLYSSALTLAPMAIPVARLEHALGVSWVLASSQITVTIGNSTPQVIDASGTVSDLLNDLLALGVTTTFTDPDLLSVPAPALLEGSGSDSSSQTDALQLFSSSLWTMLDAYGSELNEVETNLIAALDELYMNTADGEVLDVWGGYFGILRNAGEDDPIYYARIVREVLRPRNNRFAIESAIFDNTGLYVSLREPMKEIFRLSVSGLSGGDHLQDGHFFTWNVFQPIYVSPLTLAQRETVLAIIDRNRPAGCLIVGADVQPPTGYAEAAFAWGISTKNTLANYFGNMMYEPGHLSASLYLSNEREQIGGTFKWTEFGNIVLIFGVTNSLDLFHDRRWEDPGGWDDYVWSLGSLSNLNTFALSVDSTVVTADDETRTVG